jgi:hypothetical protein
MSHSRFRFGCAFGFIATLLLCWWPNLISLKKPDYPIWKTRVCGFCSFIIGSMNELSVKIWRSTYVWSMKKRRRNIKEPTHVLTAQFDIPGIPDCPIFQIETSSFYSYEMVNISKSMLTLYISQVGPYIHVFQVMHVFLGQFGWISLKKQRSVSNDKNMNSNWRFQAYMMKLSSRWLEWIYRTHDL